MPKIVELTQDRRHICHNFDGYVISHDPVVPVLRQNLTNKPFRVIANNEQYSRLHLELFYTQNLLQADPWARTTSYFINRLGELMMCCYNESEGRALVPQVVFRTERDYGDGDATGRIRGDYNYSFRFISEKYCILCDGVYRLLLLDTGDRLRPTDWKLVTSTLICNTNATHGVAVERNFTIYDSRLDIINENKQISIALGRVKRIDTECETEAGHYMCIHWAQWQLKSEGWLFSIVKTLMGRGSLYYCAFEPRAESLIISSNRRFTVSGKEQKNETTEPPTKPMENSVVVPSPTWTQTDDKVIIVLAPREDRINIDYIIESTTDKLVVKCKGDILVDNSLFASVEQDFTTWIFQDNSLEITLYKMETDLVWSTLFANDEDDPKDVLEIGDQACLPVKQQAIANLETPIEDCDIPTTLIHDEASIIRFNLEKDSITHIVLVGLHPPLFSTNLRAGFPNAVVTRHDVDASLWLQHYNPNKPHDWSMRHEGNLHAFAYVQASKEQKKFVDCAPDLSYSIICETRRHVFLYKSNHDGANGLRNRNGPQVVIGKQQIVSLDGCGDVLGMTTAQNVVTILTEECILHLQII